LIKEGFMKKDELVANVVIIAFFIFMLINAMELRFVRRFAEMGSGFWPILMLSAATVLSLVLLISNLRKYKIEKKQGTSEISISPEAKFDLKERRKKLALSVICLLGYVVIMPWIGFVLSTLVYVLAFILALGERRKFVLALSPFLVTALAVVVFAKFIAMPLPKGVDIFAAFSRLIY
jgi:putative tricarboxylic transport membrane protein